MASPRPDPLARVDRVLAPVTWLIAAYAVVVLFAGPSLIGAAKKVELTRTVGAGGATATAEPSGPASGEDLFASSGCGSCHALAAANATGAVGPDLDEVAPDAASVASVVRSGRGGMPAFGDRLSDPEIEALSQYVAGAAGG